MERCQVNKGERNVPVRKEPSGEPGISCGGLRAVAHDAIDTNCRDAFVAASPVGLVSLACAVAPRNWMSTSPAISVLERGRGRRYDR